MRGDRSSLLAGLRLVAVVALSAGLSACGAFSDPDDYQSTLKPQATKAAYAPPTGKGYPLKGDNDPHPGVAAAHRLPIHGIDVSRYQTDIDWAGVRRAGTRFAFIKATEGGDYIDPNFAVNWRGAAEAGVPRAAYHFIYWCRPAAEQAEWFIRNVPRDATALPPVIDAEWVTHSRTCKKRPTADQAVAKIRAISDRLERHYGKLPIIYTDINFHKDVLAGEPFANAFWLRSTAALPHERYQNRRWTLWQYTQTGTIPGIRGEVDRNAFYGTEAEFQRFAATGCDPRDEARLAAQGRCGSAGTLMVAAPPPPPVTPMAEAYAQDLTGSTQPIDPEPQDAGDF